MWRDIFTQLRGGSINAKRAAWTTSRIEKEGDKYIVASAKVNRIYQESKGYFKDRTPGIHNLLWQIFINESLKGKSVTFHVIYSESGIEIVVAHAEGGYSSTGVIFEDNISYSAALQEAEELSYLVFDQDAAESKRILEQSFSN